MRSDLWDKVIVSTEWREKVRKQLEEAADLEIVQVSTPFGPMHEIQVIVDDDADNRQMRAMTNTLTTGRPTAYETAAGSIAVYSLPKGSEPLPANWYNLTMEHKQ